MIATKRRVRRREPIRLPLVLGSAAFGTNASEESAGHRPILLDVRGRRIDLNPEEAVQLREAAAAHSGRSSAARDLSLLLDPARHRRQVLALSRAEAQTLVQLARRVGLLALANEIETPAA